ncbi:MAG: VanZ family protein [Clostridia bacterium]|nr:VanZ family protein [Clostridia bacterium]
MKKFVLGILIIIWMITVFHFSNEDGVESKGTSDKITVWIVDNVVYRFKDDDEENAVGDGRLLVAPTENENVNTNGSSGTPTPTGNVSVNTDGSSGTPTSTDVVKRENTKEYKDIKNKVSYNVRKGAHFSLYFVGGILFFNLISIFSTNKKKCIAISIVCVCLYAISDEIHQYFVSARSAEIRDIAIDMFRRNGSE